MDNSRLSEQQIKANEEEKATLRTSIVELETAGKSTSEEMTRLQARVDEVDADLVDMKKKYEEEVKTSKELRETIGIYFCIYFYNITNTLTSF